VLELTARSGSLFDDWHTGKNTQHSMVVRHTRQAIFQNGGGGDPAGVIPGHLGGDSAAEAAHTHAALTTCRGCSRWKHTWERRRSVCVRSKNGTERRRGQKRSPPESGIPSRGAAKRLGSTVREDKMLVSATECHAMVAGLCRTGNVGSFTLSFESGRVHAALKALRLSVCTLRLLGFRLVGRHRSCNAMKS
jgi:hypothetical protein